VGWTKVGWTGVGWTVVGWTEVGCYWTGLLLKTSVGLKRQIGHEKILEVLKIPAQILISLITLL